MDDKNGYRLPPVTHFSIFVEILTVFIVVIVATLHLQQWTPESQLTGIDLPLVTDGVAYVSKIFQQTGRIPLWNPFVGTGEPAFESPQSFILNPLMSVPVLVSGPTQGTKIGLLLHIALAALGGWVLARMLRLRALSRVLMAILVAGSGSMAAMMGRGLYQFALACAYFPWILAGLIGVLFTTRRWAIGVLAVSSAMLIFAGQYWCVLPVATVAVSVSALGLFYRARGTGRWKFNTDLVKRLGLVLLLAAGLSAVCLITVRRDLLEHNEVSTGCTATISQLLGSYFLPSVPNDCYQQITYFGFHYAFPLVVLIVLIAGSLTRRLLIRENQHVDPYERRLVVASCIAVSLLSVWALGGSNSIIAWLYSQVSVLGDWPVTERVAALSGLLVTALCVLWFDHALDGWYSLYRHPQEIVPRQLTLNVGSRLPLIFGLFALILVGSAVVFAADVAGNWQRFTSVVSRIPSPGFFGQAEADGLMYLRSRYPGQVISVLSESHPNHFYFVYSETQQVKGDLNVLTNGLPTTLGDYSTTSYLPEFAVGGETDGFIAFLASNGYEPVSGAPIYANSATAWRLPNSPGFAFWVDHDNVVSPNAGPLSSDTTHPVTYFDHSDSVQLLVDNYPSKAIVVIGETPHPGWTVTINGQPASVEVVGTKLGVVLPDRAPGTGPTVVEFTYQPTLLYLGGVISLVSLLVFIVFILRFDVHYKRLPAPVRQWFHKFWEALITPR